MHTSQKTVPTAREHHLQENVLTQLAKGREWATPGIEAALHRALTGIDSGLEAASPRIQAGLRTIADELAGGVGAVTPRVHERITRITAKAAPPAPDLAAELAKSEGPSRKPWLIAGIAAAAALCGASLWRALRPAGEAPVEPPTEQTLENGVIPNDPAAATQSTI
ncbi:hypothetical protein [Arthrobacter sp. ISL-65]|uniref:hypothetical protein n=1 Tax=Arthrobacter sp. ISL-65 TaxID=2819112 RepID=UPI001BEA4D80|nr:hypothetical protein [Arthrobacter sp. ISL-65]MBT2548032.1 hypothetical protein [Arthrobacter sp. ISL-65]